MLCNIKKFLLDKYKIVLEHVKILYSEYPHNSSVKKIHGTMYKYKYKKISGYVYYTRACVCVCVS